MNAGDGFVGRVVVSDFGLAKNVAADSRLTLTGATMGTPAYMSPELARGELQRLTPASDVWALGCVLYELLTNRRAFEADSPAATIARVLSGQPPPPVRRLAGSPAALDAALRLALARAPRDRPSDARALASVCRAVLAGRRPRGSHRPARAAMVAVLAGACVACALLLRWATSGVDRAIADNVAESTLDSAWGLRHSDPHRARAPFERAAVASELDTNGLLRLGLLRWATGEHAGARGAWELVLRRYPDHGRAALFLGLESLFRVTGETLGDPVGRRHLVLAERAGGEDGVLARGAGAMWDRRHDAARKILDGLDGWIAELLSAENERDDPNGDPARAAAAYERALASGIPFPWALVHLGVCRSRAGDLDAAMRSYDRALQIQPAYPLALANRGILHRRLGNTERALGDLDRALVLDRGQITARLTRASIRHARGELTAARADFDAILRAQPEHAVALGNRAAVLRDLGDPQGALADVEQALAQNPTTAEFIYTRATALELLGRHDAAITAYSEFLRQVPDEASALEHRASCFQERGRHREALADLERLLGTHPANARLLLARSVANEAVGDLLLAEADARRAVALQPSLTGGRIHWAGLLTALGRLGDAIDQLRLELEADPRSVSAMLGLARVCHRRGDTPGAMAQLARAQELDPQNPHVRNNRGALLVAAGDLPGAIAEFQAAVRLRPADVGYRVSLADAFRLAGDERAARDELARSLALDPVSAERYAQRARLRGALGDAAGAIADLTVAIERAPGIAQHWFGRGFEHWNRNELEAALADFRAATRCDPDVRTLLALGLAFVQLDAPADAIPMLHEFLARAPTHPRSAEIRAKLAAARRALRAGR